MKQTIFTLVLLALVICGCNDMSGPTEPQGVGTPTSPDYQEIADRLVSDISFLSTTNTFLTELRLVQDGSPDKIWYHFSCHHGITGERPNPDWTPHAKGSRRNLPVFAEDGVELSVYIYIGHWPGAIAIPQIRVVGDLNVSLFSRGPKANDVRNEIERIITAVRKEYIKENFQQTDAPNKK